MTNTVDRKVFRARFIGLIHEAFDAFDVLEEAQNRMDAATSKLTDICGHGVAMAIHELVTEPRRVCGVCVTDYIASDTGTDKCPRCVGQHHYDLNK